MTLDDYQRQAFAFSRIDWDDPHERHIASLGLIGELGSLAAEVKKGIREGEAYTDFKKNLQQEFGDVLWYLAALASYVGLRLSDLPREAGQSRLATQASIYALADACSTLAQASRVALESGSAADALRDPLGRGLDAILDAMQAHDVDLAATCKQNLAKGASYFGGDASGPAPCMDADFPPHERLPRKMVIHVLQLDRGAGRVEVILRSEGFNVGDRLTDNAASDDGYRFHDAFHFAYVAVLGWSPVTRALLRAKRKSNSKVDEVQDGARAAVMEEAITHAMWDYARGNAMLRNAKRIDHNILTLISRMVQGLEVDKLPLHEWQKAFFVGFRAFSQLHENNGGWLLLDAETRSLTFSKTQPS